MFLVEFVSLLFPFSSFPFLSLSLTHISASLPLLQFHFLCSLNLSPKSMCSSFHLYIPWEVVPLGIPIKKEPASAKIDKPLCTTTSIKHKSPDLSSLVKDPGGPVQLTHRREFPRDKKLWTRWKNGRGWWPELQVLETLMNSWPKLWLGWWAKCFKKRERQKVWSSTYTWSYNFESSKVHPFLRQ